MTDQQHAQNPAQNPATVANKNPSPPTPEVKPSPPAPPPPGSTANVVVQGTVAHTPGQPQDFVFAGAVGTVFNIDGDGFGSSGELTIGGRQVQTTRWSNTSIKGVLPPDLPRGETEIVVNKTKKVKVRI